MITELTGKHSQTTNDGSHRASSAGLIIRQKEPLNLETPLDHADSFLTPTEMFYVRSHFLAPSLDSASYRLLIDGAVRNALSLSYQDLRNMPSETRVATLECAGNSRVFPSFSSRRFRERSGDSARSATRNGRGCHWPLCWNAPA